MSPVAAAVRRALVGAGVGLLVPQACAQSADRAVDEIVVTEEALDRYRVDDSALSKLSESIRDTPQSMAMLSKEMLDDRGVHVAERRVAQRARHHARRRRVQLAGQQPDDPRLQLARRHVPRRLARLRQLSARSVQSRGRRGPARAVVDPVRPRLDGRRDQSGDEAAAARRLTSVAVNVGSDETVRATADLGAAAGVARRHVGVPVERARARAARSRIAPCTRRALGIAPSLASRPRHGHAGHASAT